MGTSRCRPLHPLTSVVGSNQKSAEAVATRVRTHLADSYVSREDNMTFLPRVGVGVRLKLTNTVVSKI